MSRSSSFIFPMTRAGMESLAWEQLDVLLITGDAFVDHPSFGAAVVARHLESLGLRVGVISQPDPTNFESVAVLGRPRLFVGVTAGNLDSIVANYTSYRHLRTEDPYSCGGKAGKRPNRAVVVYTQMVRRALKGIPVIIGGIEASLRRVAHYDFAADKIRPSVLLDSGADLLFFGMAEKALTEYVHRLKSGQSCYGIHGTARLSGAKEVAQLELSNYELLPSYEDCKARPETLLEQQKILEANQNPYCGKALLQYISNKAVVVEPPAIPISGPELDAVYDLPFTRKPHPAYEQEIPAFQMIANSFTVVRGCPGGCAFCALGLHQGKHISSRSIDSVTKEVSHHCKISRSFRGTVSDLGGPTANAYGCSNTHKVCHRCQRVSCLFPSICQHFRIQDDTLCTLLQSVGDLKPVQRAFVSSGIRMDLALLQDSYLKRLIARHVSGQLKIAPEHLNPSVLKLMRKPDPSIFFRFLELFSRYGKECGKEQYLIPYFISGFPGCSLSNMDDVSSYLQKTRWNPRQIQDFIPTPMTMATAMYVSGKSPEGKEIFTAKSTSDRMTQRNCLQNPKNVSRRQKTKYKKR